MISLESKQKRPHIRPLSNINQNRIGLPQLVTYSNTLMPIWFFKRNQFLSWLTENQTKNKIKNHIKNQIKQLYVIKFFQHFCKVFSAPKNGFCYFFYPPGFFLRVFFIQAWTWDFFLHKLHFLPDFASGVVFEILWNFQKKIQKWYWLEISEWYVYSGPGLRNIHF